MLLTSLISVHSVVFAFAPGTITSSSGNCVLSSILLSFLMSIFAIAPGTIETSSFNLETTVLTEVALIFVTQLVADSLGSRKFIYIRKIRLNQKL
ncbi:hypothetical protein C1645_794932, partial [Glomus cerebriforme]